MILHLICGSGQMSRNVKNMEVEGFACRSTYQPVIGTDPRPYTQYCVHPTGMGLVIEEVKQPSEYGSGSLQGRTFSMAPSGREVAINTAPQPDDGVADAMADVADNLQTTMRRQHEVKMAAAATALEAFEAAKRADMQDIITGRDASVEASMSPGSMLETHRVRAGVEDPKGPYPTDQQSAEAQWNARHPASLSRSTDQAGPLSDERES